MKQKSRIGIMKGTMLAFIIVLLVLFFAAWRMPPPSSWIVGMTVVHQESGTIHEHELETTSASRLVDGLKGEPSAGSPDPQLADPYASFTVTLHTRWLPDRHYALTVTEDQAFFVKSSGRSFYRSQNPDFFHVHPAFQGIYPHSTPPSLQILGLDESVTPLWNDLQWSFQRWDGSWADSPVDALTASPDEKTPANQDPLLFIAHGNTDLRLDTSPTPSQVHLKVTDPAGNVRFNDYHEDSTLPLFHFNGRHEYQLELIWADENQPCQGSAHTTFILEMDLPPAFEVPGPHALQGEMLEFRARHLPEGAVPVFQHSLADQVLFFPLEDGYAASVPTHYGTAPGEYALFYGLEGEPLQETTLTLHSRDFHIQYLTIDAGVAAATRNEEAAAMTAKYFTPSRNHSSPERYYTEPFVIPVHGRLTTEFGETRYVNNAPTSYRHSGLDIAAPTGTPIAAVNRGKVVLAMDLITQGNTVVIDHGQGLFSVYFHLDELMTVQNKVVERGETIGTVGTTGFSTGPHLHLTMSYYRHNLEPGHFLVGEPITYQNAAHHLSPQD